MQHLTGNNLESFILRRIYLLMKKRPVMKKGLPFEKVRLRNKKYMLINKHDYKLLLCLLN